MRKQAVRAATGLQVISPMIKVLLFGRLGDLHPEQTISIELSETISTPADVRHFLSTKNAALGKALAEPQNLIALNQKIISDDQILSEGDELAFLPPVTGG